MAADVTAICNQALGEMGARAQITDFLTDTTQAGKMCRLFYNPTRQALLRSAPWGFARKTAALTSISLLTDNPQGSVYPWLDMYEYPADCLKMRYILPPPVVTNNADPDVSVQYIYPWCPPSRQWRFLPSFADVPAVDPEDPPVPTKVLLANVLEALGVYTADVEETTFFDILFEQALVAALASKLILPLAGNVNLKSGFLKVAADALLQARAVDGNEALPSTDHSVDWMVARGVYNSTNTADGVLGGVGFGGSFGGPGIWYSGYDQAWGM